MHFAEVQYGVTVEPDNTCSRTSQILAIELVVGDNDGISDSTFIGLPFHDQRHVMPRVVVGRSLDSNIWYFHSENLLHPEFRKNNKSAFKAFLLANTPLLLLTLCRASDV